MNHCPCCGVAGRTVTAITLQAQVSTDRLAELSEHDRWRACMSTKCAVVYFRGGDTVGRDATRTLPFHKGTDHNRLVCFCFGHSVADLEADVAAHEASTVRAAIVDACKAGRDDCERRNPQGRCCLGDVRQVLEAVASRGGPDSSGDGDACCLAAKDTASSAPGATDAPCGNAGETSPPTPCERTVGSSDSTVRVGLFASGGALAAAALSSACCWLPLAAIGLGASSVGLGVWLAAWRAPLLLVTIGLLAAGFYLSYRAPRCAPGEACALPNPRLRRLQRGTLWSTAAMTASFAWFPAYVDLAFGTDDAADEALTAPTELTKRYRVEGMSCAACEGHARLAIAAIPTVVSVRVSYSERSAEVVWDGIADDAAVAAAVAAVGYRATRSR